MDGLIVFLVLGGSSPRLAPFCTTEVDVEALFRFLPAASLGGLTFSLSTAMLDVLRLEPRKAVIFQIRLDGLISFEIHNTSMHNDVGKLRHQAALMIWACFHMYLLLQMA